MSIITQELERKHGGIDNKEFKRKVSDNCTERGAFPTNHTVKTTDMLRERVDYRR